MAKGKDLNVLSLFSGCGGMDLGFEGGFMVHRQSVNEHTHPGFAEGEDGAFVHLRPTRFKTVFANDILPGAREAWVNYFTRRGNQADDYHLESIVDLVKQHKQGKKVFPSRVDVVTGGFPCQDFSLAGKRKGFESSKNHRGQKIELGSATVETRGQLYMWLKEVVEITKPSLFVAENVKGLVNLANVKEIIQADFARADGNGYLVLDPMVLHAADYGVPQSRERVIFIGIRKSALVPDVLKALSGKKIPSELFPYPKPSHGYTTAANGLPGPITLSSIFERLPEPAEATDPSQQYFSRAKYMGKHCQGQIEVNLEGIGPTIRSEHHGNIEFRRLSTARGGRYTHELQEKNWEERRLTPRECALIQTFPPDYPFVIPTTKGRFRVSPSVAYKIIGNAVPPLLAYHIACRLESLWDRYFGG